MHGEDELAQLTSYRANDDCCYKFKINNEVIPLTENIGKYRKYTSCMGK